jgi:sulfatase maturation enzyme AslB (radical SAM superfamily)
MNHNYFKAYWMLTNRCNLDCSYCVLEDSPEQLQQELPLTEKLKLVDHLYHKLNIRRLTLSGGEVTLIGKRPPIDFIELLGHLRRFKSKSPTENLEVEMYTNGTLLDAKVAEAMDGVVDEVAVTIDAQSPAMLQALGRSSQHGRDYYAVAMRACQLIASHGIVLKLHSVVNRFNFTSLPNEAAAILDDLQAHGALPQKWKLYQYMSYDDDTRDRLHAVTPIEYQGFQQKFGDALSGRSLLLHFKDTEEMRASLFNVLSYGNAQYMSPGDTWSSSKRTQNLGMYASMPELLAMNGIKPEEFSRFHGLQR